MLRSLLVLSILVPGIFAALGDAYLALLMYLWFALFRPQDWLWIDITSLRMSLVLGVLLVGRSVTAGLFPNITHPLTIGMVVVLCTSILTQTVAVRPDIGWIWIDFFTRLFLSCMLLVTLTSNAKRLIGVIAVISGSMGFHAAKAGLAYLVGGGGSRFADGLAGAFVDNNGYALGTVMIMPLLLVTAQNVGLLYTGRFLPWIQRGFYAAVPLCVFTVVGTYSRGGFLALAAMTLVFVLLQRRRFTTLGALAAVMGLLLLVVPIPQSYLDRLQTIQTYDKIGEESALSRPHFWAVALRMVSAHPLGVGLKQYEAAYDDFDFSFGRYGHHRAVHNSHVQMLAELGYFGAVVWTAMFAYAYYVCFRVRVRSRHENVDPLTKRFLLTTANALITSMSGFVVGGAFLSMALNDLTWLTFGMVASLDRISAGMCRQQPATEPASRHYARAPLAFQVVGSYAAHKEERL